MAEEINPDKLLETFTKITESLTRLGAASVSQSFITQQLIADVAATNRSPAQAREYLDKLKSRYAKFIIALNPTESEIDGSFKKEMEAWSRVVLDRISFEEE